MSRLITRRLWTFRKLSHASHLHFAVCQRLLCPILSKCKWSLSSSCRFASTCTVLAVELLLYSITFARCARPVRHRQWDVPSDHEPPSVIGPVGQVSPSTSNIHIGDSGVSGAGHLGQPGDIILPAITTKSKIGLSGKSCFCCVRDIFIN